MRPTAGVQSIAAFLYDLKRLFDSIVQERGVVLFTGIRVRQRFSMVSMNAKKCNMCAIMAPGISERTSYPDADADVMT